MVSARILLKSSDTGKPGKPCDRLIAPVSAARALICVNIVVPTLGSFDVSLTFVSLMFYLDKVKMKKRILNLLTVSFFLLTACNSKNELCTCIEKGDELNQFSSELLESETITGEQEEKLQLLREEVDEICDQFKEMGPERLYELRNECGNFPEP